MRDGLQSRPGEGVRQGTPPPPGRVGSWWEKHRGPECPCCISGAWLSPACGQTPRPLPRGLWEGLVLPPTWPSAPTAGSWRSQESWPSVCPRLAPGRPHPSPTPAGDAGLWLTHWADLPPLTLDMLELPKRRPPVRQRPEKSELNRSLEKAGSSHAAPSLWPSLNRPKHGNFMNKSSHALYIFMFLS